MSDTKSMTWFKDNVSENQEELLAIGDLANRKLHEVLSLGLDSPMTTIAIYAQIFESMCSVIAMKEKDYDSFNLNMADNFEIGYDTTDNEDDEKSGNFMVYMRHLDNQKTDAVLDDDEDNTLSLCAIWNATNVKTQAEVIKEVAIQALKDLGSIINIKMESHEFVIPMFCIIHSTLIRFLKQKRAELEKSEYEINVAGLFTAGCSVNEDSEEEIYFVPSITLKLLFKNDSIASATGDDE